MAINKMAILQEVDKCIRCNGCVIACKRTWHMTGRVPANDLPHNKLADNQRVVIKSQKRVDMGPFVRFSCWHCENPPCVGRCPLGAITKKESGAVAIDPNKCDPGDPRCAQQCKTDCQRGGVPMIGDGNDDFVTAKAWKCTLCDGSYTGAPVKGAGLNGDLPTRATAAQISACAERAHEPACVYTCPAKAMTYDTRENILATLTSGGWTSGFGDGAMFWASKKYLISPPKADPFVEDHVSPMIGSLLSSPFAKAAIAPTLVVGGLMALAARRAKIEEEAQSAAGEVR